MNDDDDASNDAQYLWAMRGYDNFQAFSAYMPEKKNQYDGYIFLYDSYEAIRSLHFLLYHRYARCGTEL